MEAPDGWTRARNAILKGMRSFQAEGDTPGYSEPWHIEKALLDEGLLTAAAGEVVGFQPSADTHEGIS